MLKSSQTGVRGARQSGAQMVRNCGLWINEGTGAPNSADGKGIHTDAHKYTPGIQQTYSRNTKNIHTGINTHARCI